MKKILIATGNPAKLNEYRGYLADLPIECVSLQQCGITSEVAEDEPTFRANAIKKVKTFGQLAGLPALGDDGGLEIDALGGAPGVASRTWLGYRMTDQEMIDEVLKRMAGVPPERRTAKITTLVALYIPPDTVVVEQAQVTGTIAMAATVKRHEGYPFRSLFVLDNPHKLYIDLTPEEEKVFMHRRFAMEKLKPIIQKELI